MTNRRAAVWMIAAFSFLLLAERCPAAPPSESPDVPAILEAAETLFQAMKDRNYPATWAILTAKSRDTIVAETEDAIRAAGGNPLPKGNLREDFAAGGPVSRRYWESFLRHFDPDAALERSLWEMGVVERDRAEVLITHRGADRPAVLRMFREEGKWKAGLVETFWLY